MMRMKEWSYRPLKDISTTNIRDDISTQYNIIICIYYIDYMYRRDELYWNGFRGGGIVVEVEGKWSMLFLRQFYFDFIKYHI